MIQARDGGSNWPDLPVALDPQRDPDTQLLRTYLQARVPQLEGPLELFRFTGGHANLTYLVRSQQRDFVLKREPAGTKAKSAHDMRREFYVLLHLADIYPFAPRPVLLCEDESIFGGVFCLMDRIQGEIIRGAYTAAEEASAMMAGRFRSLIDALAQLHVVDVASAGLAGFGKPEGYRTRQVLGWCKRFQEATTPDTEPADDVIAWLEGSVPATPQAQAIIHNDFKMDNLVWSAETPERLAGVLDWEMATVGDPLMDLACTLSFWIEPGDPAPLRSLRAMPSGHPAVPSRQEALRRYASRTGIAIDDFDYYRCFGLFRRAAIEQQKYFRFVTQQTSDARYAKLDEAVRILIDSCRQIIAK